MRVTFYSIPITLQNGQSRGKQVMAENLLHTILDQGNIIIKSNVYSEWHLRTEKGQLRRK